MAEERTDRIRAEGTISVRVSAFPVELWKQWKEDCKKNFGDCHWIKAWHDHVRTKDMDKIEKLEKRITELESEVRNKKEPETGSAETFTGKIKGEK